MLFSSLFKKITKKSTTKGLKAAYNPLRDWEILLAVFTVITLVLAGLSGYLFWKINQGDIFQSDTQVTIAETTLNEALITETVTHFEAKKARLIELDGTPIVAPDPSL